MCLICVTLLGDHWYKSFLNRHPELTHRTAEPVTSASANVSEKDIRKWFYDIEEYLKSKGLFSILEDPSRVYNGDETCFLFCPKLGKVIAPTGARNVYEVDKGQAKQNLTVMFSFSAAGDVTPPLIIFPNKRLNKPISNSIPDDWGIAMSENGWMKSEIFVDYIKNIFHKNIVKQNVQFPVILFVDGHRTHLTYKLSQLCTELQIILIALYPNATRILQPADVSCFKPLKTFWKQGVLQWRRDNPYCQLAKCHFAPILQKALANLKKDAVANGFRACGLWPWNPNAIDYLKCLGKSLPTTCNNPSVDNVVSQEKSITYKEFKNFLNDETFSKLQSDIFTEHENSCPYFSSLKNIYGCLKPEHPMDNSTIDISIVDVDEEYFNFTEEEIMTMPMVFETLDDKEMEDNNTNCTTKINVIQNIVIKKAEDPEEEQNKHYSEISSGEINLGDINSEKVMNILQNNIQHHENKREIEESYEEIDKHLNEEIDDESVINIQNKKDDKCEEEKDVKKSIKDFLQKPRTPERAGKRNSVRTSFVLVSSAYKRDLEEKENVRLEKERKKEENKLKRAKRAEENLLKIPKIGRNNVNNKKYKKKVKEEKKLDEIITTRNEGEAVEISNDLTSEKVKVLKIDEDKHNMSTDKENKTENRFEKESESHTYKRKLFSDEDSCTDVSLTLNYKVTKGLCFICTHNITLCQIGIRCQKCNRIYHVTCLKKYGLYKEIFVCNSCQKIPTLN